MSFRGDRFFIACVLLLAGAPVAHAQFAVIDVAAITQLVTEVQTLEQQLATARANLTQAQAQFQSTIGDRGMQQLLAGTQRNYLPSDWSSVQNAFQSGSGAYSTLASDMRNSFNGNVVLSSQQLANLSSAGSQQLQVGRQTVAILQAISHEALTSTSARFAALQQLIDAIARAPDQKATLDLHARIGAEEAMLQNEHTKLQMLFQSAQADQWANEQRAREQVIAGHGQFASRFRPAP